MQIIGKQTKAERPRESVRSADEWADVRLSRGEEGILYSPVCLRTNFIYRVSCSGCERGGKTPRRRRAWLCNSYFLLIVI